MEQKKFIYEEPQMEVVEMETAQVLCASGEGDGTGGADEGAPRFDYDEEN